MTRLRVSSPMGETRQENVTAPALPERLAGRTVGFIQLLVILGPEHHPTRVVRPKGSMMRSPWSLVFVACLALITVWCVPTARAEDWERKLENCRIENAPRIVLCGSGLDLGGAAARAVCESQNKAVQDAADKRIEDCQAQVESERRVQANIEKARLEERLRREQAEAAAKAREAEDNPPCLDGTGKCPPKND